VVAALLASYTAAVNDPANELVYLYEIRDALSKRFKDDTSAREAMGLSRSEWSRLGQLANNDPLIQGRHRGKSFGALREASDEELSEARNIARKLVEAYLFYLEESNR